MMNRFLKASPIEAKLISSIHETISRAQSFVNAFRVCIFIWIPLQDTHGLLHMRPGVDQFPPSGFRHVYY